MSSHQEETAGYADVPAGGPEGPGVAAGRDEQPSGAQTAIDPSGPGGLPAKAPWKSRADGKTVFRREAPFIFFWIWIAFVIFNVIQVVIPDHDYFSIELTVGLLGLTGLAYACGFRPRVVADDEAILVRNPLRDHLIRWGALTGVQLGESVELRCGRAEPKKDKTVYCWALYAGRSSRRRNQAFGGSLFSRRHSQPADHGRLTAEIAELAAKDPVELMSGELATRLDQAKQRGTPAAVLESRMAWVPVATICVPALALAALVLAR